MDDERNLTSIRQPIRSNIDEFYGRCTIDELHGFCANRQRYQVHRPSRQACLITLKQLDKAARFRFLALPRDLRLILYDEVLLFDNEHERALCPQILATCKQVYEEAMPIFQRNFQSTTLIRINYEESVAEQRDSACNHGAWPALVPRTCWYDTSTLVTETPGSVQLGYWSKLPYTWKHYGLLQFKAPPEIRNKERMLVYLRLDAQVDHLAAKIWQHLDALVEHINANDSKIKHADIRIHQIPAKELITCDTWLSFLQDLATCIHSNIEISVQGLPEVCPGPTSRCRCRGSVIDTLQGWRLDQYRYQKYGLA
ncbi:hypothetical protein AC578_4475 [Pseudocercospora eumusae]|uniref:Uncharacterized protein n=1 Tax=Pseudocercospora eumusae TaxID=321146 RepID=A0A139HBP0_9PEZI|nr:hypothetical protein AC578_4475 [Pseudocercospora eumusae]